MSSSIPKWRTLPPLQWLASVLYTSIFFLDSVAFGVVIVLLGWLPFRLRYGLARAVKSSGSLSSAGRPGS